VGTKRVEQFFLWIEPLGMEDLVVNSCFIGGLVVVKEQVQIPGDDNVLKVN
jgi:hypothetical protein